MESIMEPEIFLKRLDSFKKAYPEKFVSEDEIFSHPVAVSRNTLSRR
jgi:hypothetical protein